MGKSKLWNSVSCKCKFRDCVENHYFICDYGPDNCNSECSAKQCSIIKNGGFMMSAIRLEELYKETGIVGIHFYKSVLETRKSIPKGYVVLINRLNNQLDIINKFIISKSLN